MGRREKSFLGAFIAGATILAASSALALPALQLGPGNGGGWNYDNGTQTWVNTSAGSFNVNAFANSDTAGANGQYAWDLSGASAQIAFLVISAVPVTPAGPVDLFDVSVAVAGQGALTLRESGYGVAPLSDANSLAPHGLFNPANYYEMYEFRFDGPVVQISDQQPGGGVGTGDGHEEKIAITVNSTDAAVYGVHFDLLTFEGDGTYDPILNSDVNRFAPFSHDAEWTSVAEPVSLGLFGIGLVGFGIAARRRLQG